jgi:hypothetical protein
MHEIWEGRRGGSQRSLMRDGRGLQTRFSAKGFAGVKTSGIPTSRKF